MWFKSEAELAKTTVPVWFLQQELRTNPSGYRGALIFLSSSPLLFHHVWLLGHLPRSLRCLFYPPCCHLSLLESWQPAVSTTPSPLAAASGGADEMAHRASAGAAPPGPFEMLLVRFDLFISSVLRCCGCFWTVFVFIRVWLSDFFRLLVMKNHKKNIYAANFRRFSCTSRQIVI